MERYAFIEKRGEGTFAEVWEVQDKLSGKRAALKILKKRFTSIVEVFQDAEFKTLRTFSSVPNTTKPGALVKSSRSRTLNRSSREDMSSLMDSNTNLLEPGLFHPHLTGLHDAFFEPVEGKVVFVLELLGKSLLDEIVDRKAARGAAKAAAAAEHQLRPSALLSSAVLKTKQRPLFTEGELRVVLFQIFSGVYDMHSRNIFHRDIKPENILFQSSKPADPNNPGASSLRLKLADFGSCQFSNGRISRGGNEASSSSSGCISTRSTKASVGDDSAGSGGSPIDPLQNTSDSSAFIAYTEYIATRWYRSPECLLTSGHYGPPMDLWAIGCVAVELLTGHPLFPGENETHQLQLIHSLFGYPTRNEVERHMGPVGVHLSMGQSFAQQTPSSPRKHVDQDLGRPPRPSFPKHSHWKLRIIPKILGGNVSESLSDLLHRLLAYYPSERITAKLALQHEFFSDVYSSPGNR